MKACSCSFLTSVIVLLSVLVIALFLFSVVYYLKYKKAHKDSIIDPLTGLNNMRYLRQRFVEETSRAKRLDHKICLLYLDINKFKQVNDDFGHAEGDKILKKAAEAMKKVMRSHDVVIRNGGDEFLILASEISIKDINVIVEKLKEAIKSIRVAGNIQDIISTSIGVHFIHPGESLESAIVSADRKMYLDKKLEF